MIASRDSTRIPELDGLRGIAIGTVLFFHYFVLTAQVAPRSLPAYVLATFRLTWSGVDLFFVLSGFLIGGILLAERDAKNYFVVFYTRRFFRIVPAYGLLLVANVVLLVLVSVGTGRVLQPLLENRLPTAAHVVFMQNFWMAARNTLGNPMLAVTWSLAVEEQFYLTLPVVIRLIGPRRLPYFLVAATFAAVLLRALLCAFVPNNEMARFVLMPCRADALLLGVLAAFAMREPQWRSWLESHKGLFWVVLGGLAFGVVVLTKFSPGIRSVGMALFGYTWLAAFYVCAILCSLLSPESYLSRALRWRWLRSLGQIAYGAYLVHFTILYLLFLVLRSRLPTIDSAGDLSVVTLAVVVTLTVCQISWRYFEKPLIRIGHKKDYIFSV